MIKEHMIAKLKENRGNYVKSQTVSKGTWIMDQRFGKFKGGRQKRMQ